MAEWDILNVTTTPIEENLPVFKQYAYDFEKNEFLFDGDGNMILLEGNEALAVWLVKMLKTARFTYLAYSDSYGCEVYEWLGKVTKKQFAISEMRRLLTESIMTNPYIKAIDAIEFNHDQRGNRLDIEITLSTIYGKLVV